ncbi:MAG: hypothetical protein QOI04_2257 [Verrucomicrobiota bacterium]|jgi:hypothetical protein
MTNRYSVFLFCIAIAFVTACDRKKVTQLSSDQSATGVSPAANIDACTLIKAEEIQEIQGAPLKDTKKSENNEDRFRVSQCYFAADPANRSVSLTVTQSNKQSVRDFWAQTFARGERENKESDGDREKRESLREKTRGNEELEHESVPPRKLDGLGDDAYWVPSRVGGALYVLKKNAYFIISVGGADNEQAKIDKSKSLARKVIGRL